MQNEHKKSTDNNAAPQECNRIATIKKGLNAINEAEIDKRAELCFLIHEELADRKARAEKSAAVDLAREVNVSDDIIHQLNRVAKTFGTLTTFSEMMSQLREKGLTTTWSHIVEAAECKDPEKAKGILLDASQNRETVRRVRNRVRGCAKAAQQTSKQVTSLSTRLCAAVTSLDQMNGEMGQVVKMLAESGDKVKEAPRVEKLWAAVRGFSDKWLDGLRPFRTASKTENVRVEAVTEGKDEDRPADTDNACTEDGRRRLAADRAQVDSKSNEASESEDPIYDDNETLGPAAENHGLGEGPQLRPPALTARGGCRR